MTQTLNFIKWAGVITVIFFACCCCHSNSSTDTESYLLFPEKLTPVTPYDVDTALERKLLSTNQFTETQRIFEILSWQMFISLNWPVDENGKPKGDITDTGKRIWESWKESAEIFKEDGSAPLDWGSSTEIPVKLRKKRHAPVNADDTETLFRTNEISSLVGKKGTRVGKKLLFRDTADEVNQAFTSPIWDQSGNIVRYEIRLNRPEVNYIVTNELYNINGQIAFSKTKKVNFNASTRDTAGSIEIKLAWKVMVDSIDFPERYYWKYAYVLEKDGSFAKRKVGLVGMHIGTKTISSPQWIWATFEHVDNLETNDLVKINGKPLHPSFYDPANAIAAVNLIPDTTQKIIRNQIQRVLPIPLPTQELNKQVQQLLKAKKSFWQYYQLIGTQWPTQPSAAPYPYDSTVLKLPDAVTNKSGGFPTPVYLTNMIMETYFQGGTIVGNTPDSTFYNKFLGNEPAFFQIQGFPQNVDVSNTGHIIFGTEGCVNCHFSAAVATGDTMINGKRSAWYGKPGTGDFEWLLQLKAHFKKDTTAVAQH